MQIQQASTLLIGCPACDHNFKHFFCTLTCHPDQSTFVNVTDVQLATDTNRTAVKEVMVAKCACLALVSKPANAAHNACLSRCLPLCRHHTMWQMPLAAHSTAPARCVGVIDELLSLCTAQTERRFSSSMQHGAVSAKSAFMTRTFLQDVVYGLLNIKAIQLVGGGAQNFQQWFDFLGLIKDKQPTGIGAPYQMDFPGEQATPEGMTAMNESIPTCWDSAFKCSCGDCPDAPTCVPVSSPAAPSRCSLLAWQCLIHACHAVGIDFSIKALLQLSACVIAQHRLYKLSKFDGSSGSHQHAKAAKASPRCGPRADTGQDGPHSWAAIGKLCAQSVPSQL